MGLKKVKNLDFISALFSRTKTLTCKAWKAFSLFHAILLLRLFLFNNIRRES